MIFIVLLPLIALVVFLSRTADAGLSAALAESDRRGFGAGRERIDWRVAYVLAQGESRRLLRHPAFLLGVVSSGVALALTVSRPDPDDLYWWTPELMVRFVPLGWFLILASNLAALRSRRHGTSELLATVPATPATVTGAHLLTAVPVAVVAFVALVATVAWRAGTGSLGALDVAEALPAVVIVAGGVVAGVAVSRWLPSFAFAAAAVVVVTVIQGVVGTSQTSPTRFFAFGAPTSSAGHPMLEVRPSGWHLAYVVAMTIVLAGAALARHGWARVAVGFLAVGGVVAGVSGWAQSRPVSETRAAEMVAFLEAGDGHVDCATRNGIEYCAYEGATHLIDEWAAVVEPVLARVPGDGRAVRISQRPATVVGNDDCSPTPYPDTLVEAARRRLDPQRIWPADGGVHPTFGWPERLACGGPEVDGLFLAVQTGAAAVGLPPALAAGEERCRADGQARAQIALWAALQSSPPRVAAMGRILKDGANVMTFPGWDSPPVWAVAWLRADIELALELTELPASRVEAALAADWQRWTDPTTPASELWASLGEEMPIPQPALLGDGRCG